MYHIALSTAEKEDLSQVVQNSLVTLELEMQHKDQREFLTLLKHCLETLCRLADKL